MQKLKNSSLIILIIAITLMILGTYLFNQHLQRKADLQLAQLTVEQTQAPKNQTADITQSASEPADQDLNEDATTQTTHVAVSADEIAGALAVVEEAKASQKSATEHLTMQVDSEYHEGKTLSSNAAKYGLKPIKTAPTDLKTTVPSIDQMLASHLMEVWGRSSVDQVAKRVEGWSQQGNSITYRTAWDSDRYQCTWYVVSWNQSNNQVLNEGYKPCF
ncbi:hypothetical protein [Acinetobacter nematophilus]|uniref:Uncharacterized protein n=1 Tax=Acinetobacter nematophilus TaxID=2994642 RepID=A0A9X3DTM9_9GAMM|nr:hypothetical protein [Acinetobacter nematophilus]MCX5468118.1 hypothetical protein [Acinetobacter nematophilus]